MPEKKNSKITFIRKYIEELNFSKVFKNVDLVICRHTLEHIRNPKKILKKIFKEFNPETKIIIEVPDFNKMLKKLRLDAIIHQHYYYFEKETLNNVINESGGRVTDILEYDDVIFFYGAYDDHVSAPPCLPEKKVSYYLSF